MSATILVVDDLLPNVKLLEAKLTNEYYDVLTARNGMDAIKIAQSQPVDVILLDVMMPEMDGFEACRQLKADPRSSHIPVVMLTALSEMEDRIQGLKAGADDFLTKPVGDTALLARIRSLARMKIMVDELRLRDQTGNKFGALNASANELSTAKANILIIDDDGTQAKHISSKLSTLAESKIEILTDPTKALENILSNSYDLAIISTVITNFDALRLCSHIRSHEKIRHLPILILVEEADNQLIKALDMGVNDYSLTPVEVNELLARVITQIKRKRYQDALKTNYQQNMNLAITDDLTKVYNRRYFDSYCKTLVEDPTTLSKGLGLVVLDIDYFKKVNDTHGHSAGDEILRQFVLRVSSNVRVTDLVARYGGEEFVVVVPSTNLEVALQVGEKIRAAVQETPFKISESMSLDKTTSVGVTILKAGDTVESLFKRADKALYKAKESGRNKVLSELED